MQTAYFAGGCFWCVEAIFQRVDGVLSVTSGYANGDTSNPTYQDVCTGKTGHAEAVRIEFEQTDVSFQTLLKVFFATHDPTTLNQQGNDRGTQYRSAIFYTSEQQRTQAKEMIAGMSADVVTELAPLAVFYAAENYHQNYFNNNQNQPYCQMLIVPKLAKYFDS